ncbi:MAG TPA: TonB-dependent receptor [Gemmatimonadales bacterium]
MNALALLLLTVAPQGDTLTRRDTTKLPDLEVRVTRAEETRSRIPMAVGVVAGTLVRRAQLTSGLDESLSRLPGVVVLNRYNFSLDQRVSLRGAGSRANFGLRGIKVLIDGVPQTLPDGQTQLSNLELGLVDRVEVLTGSAGALYGNASGGVFAFATETPSAPWEARVRASGGSFGTRKWQSVAGAARGRTRALVSLSRFSTDGFRQHSAATAWQFAGKADLALDQRSSLGVRFAASDAPRAENPGALTAAEYAEARDSAAGSNILRGADKQVSQQQLALRYHWVDGGGRELDATAFGLLRDLKNPLATPPPTPPTSASIGTYNRIDRRVGGVRVSGTLPLLGRGPALRLTAGLDAQTMRDDRQNERSDAGVPTGQLLADQRETVSEVGPFAQLHWEAGARVALLAAVRYDRLAFRVRDRLLTDGVDNSGARIMRNASGSLGASVRAASAATLYGNLATSFESPTTTELVNTSNGTAGFNSDLGPQRTVSLELGVRGQLGTALEYSLAAFTSRISDAIIQVREADGRAFFQNAGKVRNRGIEAGAGVSPWRWLRFQGAYTFASYTFSEYRIRNGATTDTLDGHRLAGVPKHFLRATLTLQRGPVVAELDQLTAGAVFADDRNTVEVAGWGRGVTSLRLSASANWGGLRFEPFGAVNNLFDKKYVGSVNLNGAFGRILEPAPGRNGYLGMEVAWAAPR